MTGTWKKALISALLAGAMLSANAAQHGPLLLAQAALQWEQLSPAERQLLRRHAGRWSGYSAEQRQRLHQGAQRYLHMPGDKRRAIQNQAERFQNAPPREKQRWCLRYLRERGRVPPFCEPYL